MLLLSLIAFASVLFAPALCAVVELDPALFEHDTQATTGATTGHWLVCFTKCEKISKLMEALSEEEEVIDAGVIVANSAISLDLGYRFGIEKDSDYLSPNGQGGLIVLFRQKMMYYYDPDASATTFDERLSHLKAFAVQGYASAAVKRETPPELSSLQRWKGLVEEIAGTTIDAPRINLINLFYFIFLR